MGRERRKELVRSHVVDVVNDDVFDLWCERVEDVVEWWCPLFDSFVVFLVEDEADDVFVFVFRVPDECFGADFSVVCLDGCHV